MTDNANLFSVLRERFSASLDKVCLRTPSGITWTYGEIDTLSAQFATTLRQAGVTRGDRVVVQINKSPGAVALYLGVLRSGAVFVPLNTNYTAKEVRYFLHDAEPKVFISRPQKSDELVAAVRDAGVSTHLLMSESADEYLWHDALQSKPTDNIEQLDGEDLAALVYTSGTTGQSKGAMITHRALVSNALALHRIWGFEPDDVLLHALPIYHIHGLFVALHTAMLNGSTVIFLPAFNVETVRRELANATIFMGVPTFYSRLMNQNGFGQEECRHVRLFISGSAPLTAQASEQWTAQTGTRILERYGMTEAGMIASNPLGAERIPGTVGYALPDIEIRICDDSGVELPPGEIGCIEVRGPNLFSGYWRNPEKTAEDIRQNGFFITGDLGIKSPDGRLTIVGRSKDLIISGGINIYPKEIESVLDAVDGISESAVIGVPHKDFGEGIVAILVADDKSVDETAILAALKTDLARFKHPRKFFWVDELPRNTMGKVQKNVLCETYKTAYNL